jgi:glycosyltransferase involved in cell wall biosynthesis
MMRILFVSIQNSPHTARWIKCIASAGWDLHMFGIDHNPPNKLLRGVTLHIPSVSKGKVQPPARPGFKDRVRRFLDIARSDPGEGISIARRKLSTLASRSVAKLQSGGPAGTPGVEHGDHEPVRLTWFEPTKMIELGSRYRFGETGAECDALHGPESLAEVIERVKPDLIHSMEFQHCAYLVLAARDKMGARGFPPWLATNWGSDIFLFGRDPNHAPMIRRVLEAANLYSCECHRDVPLAREFGYRGPDLPVLPNSGAMDLVKLSELRTNVPPSQRKKIMVKGYDHFAGRAMISLSVLERLAHRLMGYEVIMYSVSARPRARALELKAEGKLNIRIIDYTEHEEILSCFAQSRLYLGVSISDAISTSVLEAMAMGCFPIQTDTSCCEEWFEDGIGGFSVPVDEAVIAEKVERALLDDSLVDTAEQTNRLIIETRLSHEVIHPQVMEFYRQASIFCEEARKGAP